jgi:hypothetical protein
MKHLLRQFSCKSNNMENVRKVSLIFSWSAMAIPQELLLLPRRYSPIGPRPPLMRFRNLTLIDNLVGLLGRVISPSQGRYLHRTTPTQIDISASSGIRTHDPNI